MKRVFLFLLYSLVLASCGQIKFYNDNIKFYGDEDIEPSHKITYTSTGGKVEPYNDDFGADIKSNKIDGNQGVIKFRGAVTKIGYRAFYNCDNLTSITIPDSATEIGSYAFAYCKNLTSVTIPDSVEEIGTYAFYYCSDLTSVTIPDSVNEIGYDAFDSCSRLKSFYCKALTPPLLSGTGSIFSFLYTDDMKIYVPRASVYKYKTTYGWSDYEDIIVGYDF